MAGFLLALAALAGLSWGCFEPRRERPRERITRLRLGYRVAPNWREMQKGKDGEPALAMELMVTNTGKESLAQVTLVLHVTNADGKDRVRRQLTLDTATLVPGVPAKVTVMVPRLEVRAGEDVILQMEGQPTADEMDSYPEYRGVN